MIRQFANIVARNTTTQFYKIGIIFKYGNVNDRKISPSSYKHAALVKKMRSATNLNSAIDIVVQNLDYINQEGQTLTLQFFNEFYMEQRYNDIEKYIKLEHLVYQIKNLNLYEKLLKLSIMKKLYIYFQTQQFKENFDKKLQLLIDQINNDLERTHVDIYDAINILMIFKIQQHISILKKALNVVEREIQNLDKSLNLQKCWKIILHQFTYIPWHELRNYKKTINFISENIEISFIQHNTKYLTEYFYNLVQLQLHKVGPQKIPKSMKQIVKHIKPRIQLLSLQQLSRLINAFADLPSSFQPQLQNLLVKRLVRIQNMVASCAQFFPYRGLSNADVNNIYCKKQNCGALWFSIVYESVPRRQNYFFRGVIMDYFRQMIHSNKKVEDKFEGTERPFQVVVRYAYLAYYFNKARDDQTVQIIKKMLISFFDKFGFDRMTNQFSFSGFLMLMQTFQTHPALLKQIKNKYQYYFDYRLTTNRFGKYKNNILVAVQQNISSTFEDVREGVLYAIKALISQNQQIDYHHEVQTLFQIINSLQYTRLTELKQKIWAKIKTKQQFQILLQYYILYYKKTFKGCQQLVKKFNHYKISPHTAIKFISAMNIKLLENNRGKLQHHLQNYLKENKDYLQGSLQTLNQITRVISMLSQYNVSIFLKRIYLNTLNNIQKQIKHPQWKLQSDYSMLIFNFLFKFQKLINFSELNLPVNKAVLQKVFGILKILLNHDKHLYIKAKFAQFCLVYKQFINIKEGSEISSIFELQQSLKNKQNPQSLGEIYFILLRLHCFRLHNLKAGQIAEYASIISMSIKNGKLNVFQAIKHVQQIMYEMGILKINDTQLQMFQQIINPLVLQVLQSTTQDRQFKIIKPFLLYFLKTNQINKLDSFIIKILKNFTTPRVLEDITSIYPISLLTDQIMQLLIKKIGHNQDLFDNNSYKILFYFQKIFFKTPEKYIYFQQNLWKTTNKYLYKKILLINSKQTPYQLQSYYLGRFPLYMFACIKSGKTDTKIFKHLSDFVKKNPKAFMQKIRSNDFLKFVNQNVLNYITAGESEQAKKTNIENKNKKIDKYVEIFINMNFSRQLEDSLTKQNISYKKNWVIDGVLVPYYVQSKKEVIMVVNKHNTIKITSQLPFNGVAKFQYEVIKKILKNKKITIYDDVNKKMLQI